jgi:SAM-dependent methyltransferase
VRREDWDQRYAEVENLWSTKPNRFLVGEVAELDPGRSLDLACGEGQNSIWLARLGWEAVGVDFSPVAIEKARARALREGVDVLFVCHDLLEYIPEPEAHELVLVLYLHLPADERRVVLDRSAGALAPGGTLVLLGHDVLNATEGVGGPSDESILYTPDDIAAELPGLEIEKAERVLRDVAGADRPAIDALVRARKGGVRLQPHPVLGSASTSDRDQAEA